MRRDIEDIKQYQRSNNLVISGFPKDFDINPYDVVIDIGSQLKVTISRSDIDIAHWLRSRREGAPKSLIVRFVNRWKIEQLKTSKLDHGSLDTKQLGYTCATSTIYINDHLSPKMQHLQYQARMLKRSKILSQIWFSKGSLMVKTAEGQELRIQEEEDFKVIDGGNTSVASPVSAV